MAEANPKVLTGVAEFVTTIEAPGHDEDATEEVFARALQALLNNTLALYQAVQAGAGGGNGGGGTSSVFTALLNGLAPASGGGVVNFLRADGTWQPPIEGGDSGQIAVHDGAGYAGFPGLRFTGGQNNWDLASSDSSADRQVISYDRGASTSTLVLGGPAINDLELSADVTLLRGAFATENHFTDLAVAPTTHNYNKPGWSTAFVARLAPSTGVSVSTITSFAGGGVGGTGQIKLLVNVGTAPINLPHNEIGATLGNQLYTPDGEPVVLEPRDACLLVYDYTASYWRVIPLGGSATAGGGEVETPTLAQVLARSSLFGAFNLTGGGGIFNGIYPEGDATGADNGQGLRFEAQSAAGSGLGGNVAINAGNPGGNVELRPGTGGYISAADSRIVLVADPASDQDAATRRFVLGQVVTVTQDMSPYPVPHGRVMLAVASTGGPITLTLPTPEEGDLYLIKDISGQAEVNNITIEATSIDGSSAITLNENWEAIELAPTGSAYSVVSSANAAQTPPLFSSGVAGIVPASGGGTTNYLRADGTWSAPPGGGGGVPDDNSVTLAKFADIATDRLIGRDTAGTGDPELISVTGGLEFTGAGGIQRSALTGDITASAGSNATTLADGTVSQNKIVNGAVVTAKIGDDQVTYAKIQNVSQTDRILGRDSAGAGDIEELSVTGGLEFTGAGGIRRSAISGDVTIAAGATVATISNNAVQSAHIGGGQVTFAKVQNIATDRLIGRDTAGTGSPEELTVTGGLEFTGAGGIQRSAISGDVTIAAGATVATLATITTAKIGDAQVTAAKLAANAVEEAKIAANVVSLGKLAQLGANKLLGRGNVGTGDVQAISLGPSLTVVASVLDVVATPTPSLGSVLAAGNETGGFNVVVAGNDSIEIEGPSDDRANSVIKRIAGILVIDAGNANVGSGFPGTAIRFRTGSGDGAGTRGNIDLDGSRIVNGTAPLNPLDLVTKAYADALALVVAGTAAGQSPVWDGAAYVYQGVKTAALADADGSLDPSTAGRFVLTAPLTANRSRALSNASMAGLPKAGAGYRFAIERRQTGANALDITWNSVVIYTFPAGAMWAAVFGYDGTNFFYVSEIPLA